MRLDLVKDYEDGAGARPLYLAPEKSIEDARFPAPLVALARANGFNGEAGAFVASSEGVLFGVGDDSDPFILAAAAEKLPEGDYALAGALAPAQADQAVFAWLLGGYRFDRYKKLKPAVARLVAPKNADLVRMQRAADAVFLARDPVKTPATDMTPAALEDATRRIAARCGAEVEAVDGDDLIARNLPMIHAVGRAAASPPRLIDLTWGREDAPKVTLVGKGVCFDSGGLDIKPSSGMILMKKDMGGAANALALAQMIMDSGVNVRLRVLIPAVENAISGSSYRPGDILKSRKGLTVEINNTDAEGRLVLADALSVACDEQPDLLVTLATLTGAARTAVGPELAPYYTDDEALAADIAEASVAAFDPAWRMPLYKPYDSWLSSPVADLNNSPNNGFAGSIVAALFLKRFVPASVAWAHFDIYAWRTKAAPGRPIGGEAQSIRALMRVVTRRFGAGV
ncbi:MAG: leucyl aminopeptidase family protein [Parvularculaceae bacterium]|nr:leucyl aminopeptidase family protein [Parvularculaceae bacterium]